MNYSPVNIPAAPDEGDSVDAMYTNGMPDKE